MKNLYSRLIAAAVVLLPFTVTAQSVQLAHDKCLAEIMYREAIAKDPGYAVRQAQLEAETEKYTEEYIASKTAPGAQQKNAAVVRVIPVVFHVIHEGGPENVAREQLVDQIDSLNKDFRRWNADTSDTPAAFKPLGADSEIEFRIATKDPNGNCTDGVVRVYSTLTNNARDNVKALSYWPSNEYLNIWIVKSIENLNGTPGMVIGFAQFPGGNPLTDGVVLMHSFTGSIGTAANSGNNGRTATHEVGHWLNLRHIWGDDAGACTGSDFVTDTPNQGDQTMSTCPNWPQISCNNGPNGDLFSNYMDYTNGDCQNIFTIGQAARMNAALSSAVSGRNNLWTQQNLIDTGTDGTPGALCTPVAAFPDNVRVICEGASLTFTDGSWNSPVTTWAWDFPGGNPSTSTSQNPTVQYPTAGTYDVSLTVSNAAGTNSVTHNGVVIVLPYYGQFSVPYSESFETISFPGNDWPITNEAGNTWDQTSLAAKTGINSIYINNHTGNPTGTQDVFLTPTYNLSWTTQTNLTFQLAYAARSSSSADNLKVFASTNCGQVWSLRYNKTGLSGTNALATAGLVSSAFYPTSSQWRQETVNLTSSSFSNQPNVRFKFEYNHDTGNNIFIDDINLNGTVGENELFEASLDMNVFPNPSDVQAFVEFNLPDKMEVKIDVTDMLGQVVNSVVPGTLDAGEYRFELPAGLAPGVYNVRLTAGGYPATRKVIIY